jgi:hypothetical protein
MARKEGEMTLSIIHNAIHHAQVGEETTFKNLTMFPLFVGEAVEQNYETLDDALAAGTAKVTEVSDAGSVPELQFFNDGDKPVFLLDGEELVGAKQNRILNLSILAPAHMTITIPVSCVERGRWAHNSSELRSEDRVHFSRGRSAKAASVSQSMASGGSRRSNQGQVWDDISEKSAKFRVSSESESMSDIYKDRLESMKEFVGAFSSTDSQIGAIFGIDGAVAGIDLFDNPETFRKLMPKLIRSYALDALETSSDNSRVTPEIEARCFMEILANTEVQDLPAIGLGNDLRLTSQMISGGALEIDGCVIHLGAFPLAMRYSAGQSPRRSQLMRASWRRRAH